MRVLIAHNYYQQRGGEDAVMEAEVALLSANGHTVETLVRHNDSIAGKSRAELARETFWSIRSSRDAEALMRHFRPDVLHVHNTFPLLSPALYWAAHRNRVPVVQTLHNFRLLCPQAMFLRQGKVCEDCLGKPPWRAVAYRCYRASATQSAVLSGMLQAHRMLGTWRDKVTRYIALNRFCRDKFIQGGLPADKIAIKPNFVPEPEFEEVLQARHGLLFVGRLSEEKGVDVLVDALRQPGIEPVRLAGTGPAQERFQGMAGAVLLGGLTYPAVQREMKTAAALILPSIWYENFPRTIVEAFACGLPVIASRIGALAEIVEDGVTGKLFEPGDGSDLARCMRWAQDNPQALSAMGETARSRYEQLYSPNRALKRLTEIYAESIADRARQPE